MKFLVRSFFFAVLMATVPVLVAQAATSAPKCTKMTTPFVGTLCSPTDGKRHPAMILLGGSEGGDSMAKIATLFARHGYVAASVAYFGLPGLPKYLVDVPVETIGHAITALQARHDVLGNRLGIMGGSKGGEFSLLAASTYPQIHATIALVPSPVGFMGLGQYNMPTECSWSKNGKSLPCVSASDSGKAAIGQEFSGVNPVSLKPLYDLSLDANASETAAAFFPLQNIHGPVFCMAAASDAMWNSPRQCTMTMKYLSAHHHAYADQQIVYPNAGHVFLFSPWMPVKDVLAVPIPGTPGLAFGGTLKGDFAASKAGWKDIWKFLGVALGQKG